MVDCVVAHQGIVSKYVKHFDFMGKYSLKEYTDNKAPVVVFGIYDINIINFKTHKGPIILRWCGEDARMQVNNYHLFKRDNIVNVTPLPPVKKFLNDRGVDCLLMKPVVTEGAKPLKKGASVYIYLNHYKPKYHGSEIVRELEKEYPFIIGDFSVPTDKWKAGECDQYYSQSFIGLFISDYAGGGGGIVEMGLRGIPVVTNVLSLPHCMPWQSIKDIKECINKESRNIGTSDPELAHDVEACLVKSSTLDGFELDKLLI